ncbi:hypothetical protein ACU6HM_06245 [Alcaligenes sp. RM2]
MKKKDCEALTLIALAVGVGFGAVIGMATLAAAHPIFQSENWAAWIQALGSIGAIGAGFLYINRSQRLAEFQRASNERRALLNKLIHARDSINLAVSATDEYRTSIFKGNLQAADGVLVAQRKSEDYFSLLSLYKASVDRVINSDALSVESRSSILVSFNNFLRICEAFRLPDGKGLTIRDVLLKLFDISFEEKYVNALTKSLSEIDAVIKQLQLEVALDKKQEK